MRFFLNIARRLSGQMPNGPGRAPTQGLLSSEYKSYVNS
jgi:hypothetical protein